MAVCTAITGSGTRCKGIAIDSSGLCHAHHPDRAEARSRAAKRGGKRGGRGRPSSELARLQARFEELAEKVLTGEVKRAEGAVAGQLLNFARACVATRLKAVEQEEIIARLEALEEDLQARARSRAWG